MFTIFRKTQEADLIKRKKPEALLKGLVELSSLPFIYIKINDAVNNPQSSIKDIGEIISGDPGLTSRLLRLVNSPFYGFQSKIDTVSQALLMVGTQQIRDLALATSVISLFKGIPGHLVNMESLWKHSVGCGLAARMLATVGQCKGNVEFFFTAGIIHDIGRLVIYKQIPETAQKMILQCKDSKKPLFLVEKEVLGFDHSDLGRALAQLWNLPPTLEEVLACHHVPWETKQYPVEACVIHIADYIAHAMQLGDSGEQYIPPLDERVWELGGIPARVLSFMPDRLMPEFEDVVQSLWEIY
ncbi:MAG TPA: HDOD domain-containing protein [Syntrophales bacterium]|nr:HDOD domain-containing protein [Syntrophales bacterium]